MPSTPKSTDLWPTIRQQALKAARRQCQECSAWQYAVIDPKTRGFLRSTSFYSTSRKEAIHYKTQDQPAVVIVLSVIRLNGLEFDTRPENLRVLCQKCLNMHTAKKRATLLRDRSHRAKETQDIAKQRRFGFALT